MEGIRKDHVLHLQHYTVVSTQTTRLSNLEQDLVCGACMCNSDHALDAGEGVWVWERFIYMCRGFRDKLKLTCGDIAPL